MFWDHPLPENAQGGGGTILFVHYFCVLFSTSHPPCAFRCPTPPCAFRGGQREALAVARREAPAVARREAPAVVRREAPAAVRREAPVVTSDYYTSIPLLDKHAMTRQAFGY